MKTILILFLAVILGSVTGLFIPESWIQGVLVIKQICGEVIFFLVPLIIVGFVAPSIASLKGNVSRLILLAFALAYVSSVGAAVFATVAGYELIPLLHIRPDDGSGKVLPEVLFQLHIPPVLSVMSALLIAVFLGLGVIWSCAEEIGRLIAQFQQIVLQLVKRVLIPVLPVYVAANFCALGYEGNLGRLKVFLPVILIVIAGHLLWLALLYTLATIYSRRNGLEVLRHYGPAYLTALGTMSSAATLGVALQCAHKSRLLGRKVVDFGIPLFANIHLCGSVLTETFFVCVVSQLLYGHLPEFSTMTVFIFLLGVFAVGAPGVPGGTVLASLGIVSSVLGFDDAGTAMLIAIFALQDSFGTACNVTGDGALTLILDTFSRKHEQNQQTVDERESYS